eukprot:scaffold23365_cov115-Isochrysis_galbana.AAC.15
MRTCGCACGRMQRVSLFRPRCTECLHASTEGSENWPGGQYERDPWHSARSRPATANAAHAAPSGDKHSPLLSTLRPLTPFAASESLSCYVCDLVCLYVCTFVRALVLAFSLLFMSHVLCSLDRDTTCIRRRAPWPRPHVGHATC